VGNLKALTVPEGEISIPKFNFGETFNHGLSMSCAKYSNQASFSSIEEEGK
jgi:hypothetical protein